mmetsp:Transcript_93868/g.151507  ORF Transcript_93868/g.151507 Transcript_93868/m.151507 type:complete len:115 (+) Transcript_93868:527-871(+)
MTRLLPMTIHTQLRLFHSLPTHRQQKEHLEAFIDPQARRVVTRSGKKGRISISRGQVDEERQVDEDRSCTSGYLWEKHRDMAQSRRWALSSNVRSVLLCVAVYCSVVQRVKKVV